MSFMLAAGSSRVFQLSDCTLLVQILQQRKLSGIMNVRTVWVGSKNSTNQ